MYCKPAILPKIKVEAMNSFLLNQEGSMHVHSHWFCLALNLGVLTNETGLATEENFKFNRLKREEVIEQSLFASGMTAYLENSKKSKIYLNLAEIYSIYQGLRI